jgi:hypothetical protein
MDAALGIAGLVLGLFPVVVAGVDFYKGFTDREIRILRRSLKVQCIIYHQCIEELLASIATDGQLVELLQDPGGQAWSDTKLKLRLRQQLDVAYEPYLEVIEDIRTLVTELKDALQLKVRCNPRL